MNQLVECNDIVQATTPCNLCNGIMVKVISQYDRKGHPLRSVICPDCGLVWVDPRPSAAQQKQFYAEDYRSLYKSAEQPKLKHAYRETHRALARVERMAEIYQPGMRVIDIGSGGGFFPYVLQQRGISVVGIEPNHGYCAYSQHELGVTAHDGFVQNFDFSAHPFDIITINHVLEHLEDPLAILRLLYQWLKPNGYLILEVPNIEAIYHAPKGKFHVGHLYWFNSKNLTAIIHKAGFQIHNLQLTIGTQHLNAIVQRPKEDSETSSDPQTSLAGNCDRICNIFIRHTNWSHYTKLNTYLRIVSKQWRYLKEKYSVLGRKSGREVADYVIDAANMH